MITLTFPDVTEVNKVLMGLGKLPYETVVNLIARLEAEASRQLAPAPPPPPAPRQRIMPT
jgi:hypothetical protein